MVRPRVGGQSTSRRLDIPHATYHRSGSTAPRVFVMRSITPRRPTTPPTPRRSSHRVGGGARRTARNGVVAKDSRGTQNVFVDLGHLSVPPVDDCTARSVHAVLAQVRIRVVRHCHAIGCHRIRHPARLWALAQTRNILTADSHFKRRAAQYMQRAAATDQWNVVQGVRRESRQNTLTQTSRAVLLGSIGSDNILDNPPSTD
jgi:hypothetical protein